MIPIRYLMMAMLLLSACHSSIKQANKRGMEYMKQKLYEEAITEFNRIIGQESDWYPAYYNRAVSYANTRHYQEALKDFNYLLASFPTQADAYFNRGIVYENLGIHAKAIKDYSETIKLRPDFIMAYHYRGMVRFRMQDFDGALADYNKALQLGENIRMDVASAKKVGLNSSALYFNRGSVLQKKGNYQAAIQDYTKSIEINPSSARAYYNRAIANMALSRDNDALKDLEIASHLGSEQAEKIIKGYFRN